MIRKFSDALTKEIYHSVYNRSTKIKNPWWVCITEGKYVDGEFTVVPHWVVGEESNILSAMNLMIEIGLDINNIIARTLRPCEYEWESGSGDLEEVSLHFSVLHITKRGETVHWEHIEPEELKKEYI
tara:strand:+ start:1004 stop:1384 length:381 start_codon:yes stop_codon:yes gene_type:complete